MTPIEIAKWLNIDATDEQFAEVFALLEIAICGRNFCFRLKDDTETIIRNMDVDSVCNTLKTILKQIQKDV